MNMAGNQGCIYYEVYKVMINNKTLQEHLVLKSQHNQGWLAKILKILLVIASQEKRSDLIKENEFLLIRIFSQLKLLIFYS